MSTVVDIMKYKSTVVDSSNNRFKHYLKNIIMNNKIRIWRRQAIKGIGAVALGTTALAASSTAKANEKN